LRQQPVEFILMNPGMRAVRGNDPERPDLTAADAIDDLVVRPTRLTRNALFGNVQQHTDFSAMLGVFEIVPAVEARDVRIDSRTHRVALTGNAVRPRAGPPDITGHQGKIDDGLRRASRLVTLIHTHRPPERDALARCNRRGDPIKLLG